MRQLFSRSFSSVFVHYIPLCGYGHLGSSRDILTQTDKLSQRVKQDAERVQNQRKEAWTRFTTAQLSQVVHYAFAHLATGSSEPFDFNRCRRKISIPDTLQGFFSEFLIRTLKEEMETSFEDTAAVIATSLLRRYLAANKGGWFIPYGPKNTLWQKSRYFRSGLTFPQVPILHPDHVFNKENIAICEAAMENFLRYGAKCTYIDADSGERCVNTKRGHKIGHQNKSGKLLDDGQYQACRFTPNDLTSAIDRPLREAMEDITPTSPSDWHQGAVSRHRVNLATLRRRGKNIPTYFRKSSSGKKKMRLHRSTDFCLGCLHGRPEYRLPCNHVICETCLEDFAVRDKDPGRLTNLNCAICGSVAPENEKWPHSIRVRPQLAGLRVLTLDGGGVRGIIELRILNRLEEKIGLGIPLGQFFDLIVGTSTGKLI